MLRWSGAPRLSAGHGRPSLLIAVAAVALAGGAAIVPALAATTTLTASGNGCPGSSGWNNVNNATYTIQVGDSVTWQNCTPPGDHTLQAQTSNTNPFCGINSSSQQPLPFTCTFSTPGTYQFWCGVHHSAMAGTITVQAQPQPTPTPHPTPTPQPTHSNPPGPTPSHMTPHPTRPPTPSSHPATSGAASPSPSAPVAEVTSPSAEPGESPSAAVHALGANGSEPPWGWILGGVAVLILGAGGLIWRARAGR